MNDQTDQQLLRDYAERQSETAFAAIVERYVDLVYSAAFRNQSGFWRGRGCRLFHLQLDLQVAEQS